MSVKRQMICWFIAFILIFSGICMQQIHADSLFQYAQNEEPVAMIVSGSHISSMNACTTEMIERQSFSRLSQANRTIHIRRDLKLVSQLICCITVLDLLLKFFSTEDTIYFKKMDCSTVAIKYIQNTDGKKRI